MALKEIQIKQISELPSHRKAALKEKFGPEVFNNYAEIDALVEIRVASSIPHIQNIDVINGTFSDKLLSDINRGEEIEDIFKY